MNQRASAEDPQAGEAATRREQAGRWGRRLLTIMLIATLVSPVIRNHDSLPLSTYPMYSGTRSNISGFVTASGVDRAGDRTPLSPLTISASRSRLITQSFLNDAVRRGDAADVCAEIASRADRSLSAIEIATERHDTTARLRGEPSLEARDLHANCAVPQ